MLTMQAERFFQILEKRSRKAGVLAEPLLKANPAQLFRDMPFAGFDMAFDHRNKVRVGRNQSMLPDKQAGAQAVSQSPQPMLCVADDRLRLRFCLTQSKAAPRRKQTGRVGAS